MRARIRALFLPVTIAAVTLASGPAALAQVDPFSADPLGLVAHADQGRVYAAGTDAWEVWVCDVPDGPLTIDPQAAVTLFNTKLTPYFSWLSSGTYRPQFRVGGVLEAFFDSRWPDNPLARQLECEQAAQLASSNTANGALVIVDANYEGGYATPGAACETASDCPRTFPDNGRIAVVGGDTVLVDGVMSDARLRTVAHEIGHGLSLPHSFGGLTTFLGGLAYEYDNPMDLMSGGEVATLDIGTIALNRYAAGWIPSASAVFHRGGSFTYEVGTIGTAGSQFVVLPSDAGNGVFDVLAPRVRSSFDSGIPAEGIEVYAIDQRGAVCGLSSSEVCWGIDRRTAQVPAVNDPESVAHVFGVGSTFNVKGVTVEVVAQTGSMFTVRLTGASVSQRFVDDNGNVHETAIASIADRGITLGCSPPTNELYCPGKPVTRAEMSVFLVRALGESPLDAPAGFFPDVAAGEWYTPFVEKLFELGITAGYDDGTFRPQATVSRAEMSAFLTKTFTTLAAVDEPTGVFVDVAPDEWYAPFVEGILTGGVTSGCATDPLQFCPDSPVLRDQMGTFLARALGM